jgi:integrase/recombinase XerD
MMQRDLESARDAWLEEAKENPVELKRRKESDYLAHKNDTGLFANFHSLRHYFITSLERSGASPKMAQTLARHSDIRLTLGIYTHVGIDDQTNAIEALQPPPTDDSKIETKPLRKIG